MPFALEVENVGKAYENFKMSDVSFQLEEGLIMGLIGTNGAGKTTLIQMILGLLSCDTGKIRIYGKDTKADEREAKNLCGFVLDDNPFIKPISAIGNARIFGQYYSGWNESKFIAYCKKFDVNMKKPLLKLSQGTITKFQLAFALSHDAKLLVFDEPSSGLDPIFRRELMDIMYDVIMEGDRSIIFSTHLTNELDNVADYLMMLHDGKQLFSKPKDDLLDEYLLVKGSKNQIDAIPSRYVIGKKDAHTYSEALIQKAEDYDLPMVTAMRPTIEDVMCHMIQKES